MTGRLLIAACAALAGSLVTLGVVVVADLQPSTVQTFVDDAGRTCTLVERDGDQLLDCDVPPVEDRLGAWLEDLRTTTEP